MALLLASPVCSERSIRLSPVEGFISIDRKNANNLNETDRRVFDIVMKASRHRKTEKVIYTLKNTVSKNQTNRQEEKR